MEEYNISINLYSDWIDILKKELESWGYKNNLNNKPENICHTYFNLQKKLISPTAREVLISDSFTFPSELEEDELGEDVTKESLRDGLKDIKRKIKNGESLAPYLSKKIKKDPDYDDNMLNDWGIHHLHLGSTLEETEKELEFIKRTDPLLFARFTEEEVFFIDLMGHNDWANQEIVEILHKNWPKSIKEYQLENIKINNYHSENQIKKFRKNGANTILKMEDGTVYAPLGGGYATTGLAIDVVQTCDYYKERLKQFEKDLKENIDTIVLRAEKKGEILDKELNFHLNLSKKKVFAIETSSRVKVYLGKL